MTGRDRIVLIGIAVLLVLAAPLDAGRLARAQASRGARTQVSRGERAARERRSQVANARSAQLQYSAAYASVVSLGKAVPPSQEVPVAHLPARAGHQPEARRLHLDHRELERKLEQLGGSASSSRRRPHPPLPRGFTQMPFTFVFNGSFLDL